MIRGNHEDPTINAIYGFREECRRRLDDGELVESVQLKQCITTGRTSLYSKPLQNSTDADQSDSCWGQFNDVFEWLPCGALIEDRILCIHGGIGGSIKKIEEIAELPRPLKVAQIPSNMGEQKVTDLLWSDPSDNDRIQGVTCNETRDPDGTGRIVKFGPDRVDEFLNENKPVSMIIRAHECVMDGFERFAGGKLITLFR